MKRFFLFSIHLVCGLAFLTAGAQTVVFSVGSGSALTVKSGTLFSADSLVLTPSADWTVAANNLQISHTALNLMPAPGINRVYSLGSQVAFTGTIQLYYQPSELNGNPEAVLQYTDSSLGSSWLASASSSVNTTSHYVQQAAVARNFIGATASHQGTVLALSLTAFAGVWQGDAAALSWTIDQSGEVGYFTIERSADGSSWTELGDVAGIPGDGIRTYAYADVQPPAGVVLYRLLVHRSSGKEFYSSVVKLQRSADEGLRLVTQGHSVIAYFTGMQPSAVRIVNAAGALVGVDRGLRWRYEFDALPTGVYYLQYEMKGQTVARGFLIQ
ncbi:MAG TPA: hypothetical protein VHE34_03300 [Puia sp.]|uniref:hypothetical protein n=1 Tax=Puia sp. TaxID=2045100 RepID=UPI002B8DEC30|nr:hypothetical protein [Puia sp.]HVU94218.1 hypothetical protein [Puia sp.]